MIGPDGEIVDLACGMARLSLSTAKSGVALSFALGLPGSLQPERIGHFRAYQQIPMRRPLRLSVSVSRISRDPTPILSLTLTHPSRPIRDVLSNKMPSWGEVLGAERAQELEDESTKRETQTSDRLDAEEVRAAVP